MAPATELPHKYTRWPSLQRYDQLDVAYTVYPSSSPGPLWTGHQMLLSSLDTYHDIGYWHELAHWLIATPTQRQHADYQLGRHINSVDHGHYATSRQPGINDLNNPNHQQHGWADEKDHTINGQHQETVAVEAILLYPHLINQTPWADINIDPAADWWTTAQDFNSTIVTDRTISQQQLDDLWTHITLRLEPDTNRNDWLNHLTRCAGGALTIRP